jgi:hypothetical protein
MGNIPNMLAALLGIIIKSLGLFVSSSLRLLATAETTPSPLPTACLPAKFKPPAYLGQAHEA